MGPEIWTVDIETRPTEAWVWGLYRENIPLERVIEPGGVLMFAAKKHGVKTVEAHCEWDGQEDMLRRAHEIYDGADYVVTYNGANFDNRHLRAAWAQIGLPPPSPWRDVDLLKTVRKNFNLPSRKLSYVAGALGLGGKFNVGGMDTWRQILKPESEEQMLRAQRRMIRYCKQDVKLTEQLFDRLLPWIDGLNIPLMMEDSGGPSLMCTRCGSTHVTRRGYAYTTSRRYQRYQCQSCMGWMKDHRSEPHPSAELRNV